MNYVVQYHNYTETQVGRKKITSVTVKHSNFPPKYLKHWTISTNKK